jgi:hypothetical protein
MSKHQNITELVGQKVLVNRAIIAVIDFYDEDQGTLIYTHNPVGGGTDRVTAHVNQLTIEPLSVLADSLAEEPVTEAVAATEEPEATVAE